MQFRKIGEGQYERVWAVDTNPRPEWWGGRWADGSTLYKWFGEQSGLFAYQRTWIGGHEAWYTPTGQEVEWYEYPCFLSLEELQDPTLFVGQVFS